MRRIDLIVAAGVALAVPALAQMPDELAAAQRAGVVGERYDGYLGFRATPSAMVRRQVGAINIKRRALYVGLAQRRNVTVEVAGLITGCELLSRLGAGDAYLLGDGEWRVLRAGESVPKPSYCP